MSKFILFFSFSVLMLFMYTEIIRYISFPLKRKPLSDPSVSPDCVQFLKKKSVH